MPIKAGKYLLISGAREKGVENEKDRRFQDRAVYSVRGDVMGGGIGGVGRVRLGGGGGWGWL